MHAPGRTELHRGALQATTGAAGTGVRPAARNLRAAPLPNDSRVSAVILFSDMHSSSDVRRGMGPRRLRILFVSLAAELLEILAEMAARC